MKYTDEELFSWWDSLSKTTQRELIVLFYEKTQSEIAQSFLKQYDSGRRLSAKQLHHIRKWAD